MKRVFLIPNAITAFALACGLFVIFKISLADPGRDLFSLLQSSTIVLLIAAVADVADGAVARLVRAESEFGGQFDSLSDAVTFGVAPPLLVLRSLTGGEGLSRLVMFFVIFAAMIYSLCGVLRLVRYNLESKREAGERKHFTGLPIPAAAMGVVSAALLLIAPLGQTYVPLGLEERAWVMVGVLVALGYFMVSRWKFPSVKALHFRVPSFYLVFATGIFAVMVFHGILDYFAEAFFIVSWLYLVISCLLSVIRLIAGKRSRALADFEPEQED